MSDRKGFTLIETLITTLVLVTGLTAIAGLFSYGAQTSHQNRQRTAATALVYSKMEELRNDHARTPGETTEYLVIVPDGSILITNNAQASYMRVWKVEAGSPQLVTVTVFARQTGRQTRYLELARAATLVGRSF